jgi:hypothetical protein
MKMASRIARLKGNRIFTVALAIAAVTVWSSIALRIAEPTNALKVQAGKVSQDDHGNFRDSMIFSLDLNYDDPFQVSSAPKPVRALAGASKVSAKAMVREPIKVPDIFYFGSMINSAGDRKALVRHSGKYYYAAVNDTIGTFLVKRVHKDSITMVSGRQVFHARRRNPD